MEILHAILLASIPGFLVAIAACLLLALAIMIYEKPIIGVVILVWFGTAILMASM